MVEQKLDLHTTDGDGRTPQQIAEATKANTVSKWISTYKASVTVSSFISRNIQRIRSIQNHRRIVRLVTLIQKIIRGHLVQKRYYSIICTMLEKSQQFKMIWAPSISQLSDQLLKDDGWEAVRSRTHNISHADVADQKTVGRLDDAISKILLDFDDHDDHCDEDIFAKQTELAACANKTYTNHQPDAPNERIWSDTFQVTSHVIKFLKSGDPLYRSFFVRRMKQLARGDRSRILQKRLKGSKSAIYETYLEQKSAFRILWTEESDTIVVWFVAKHKSVPRLIRLIDDAKRRTARQRIPEHLMEQPKQASDSRKILLDIGNAPLKVYDIDFHAIDDMTKSSWAPQMHLTEEEKSVVEAKGTVLLLGRSG